MHKVQLQRQDPLGTTDQLASGWQIMSACCLLSGVNATNAMAKVNAEYGNTALSRARPPCRAHM